MVEEGRVRKVGPRERLGVRRKVGHYVSHVPLRIEYFHLNRS